MMLSDFIINNALLILVNLRRDMLHRTVGYVVDISTTNTASHVQCEIMIRATTDLCTIGQ